MRRGHPQSAATRAKISASLKAHYARRGRKRITLQDLPESSRKNILAGAGRRHLRSDRARHIALDSSTPASKRKKARGHARSADSNMKLVVSQLQPISGKKVRR